MNRLVIILVVVAVLSVLACGGPDTSDSQQPGIRERSHRRRQTARTLWPLSMQAPGFVRPR